jgi:hypothetical protein
MDYPSNKPYDSDFNTIYPKHTFYKSSVMPNSKKIYQVETINFVVAKTIHLISSKTNKMEITNSIFIGKNEPMTINL